MTAGGMLTATATAHVVQTALAPVFMLSGIGALLNVFATRLARVGDQADQLAAESCDAERELRLRSLRRRSQALDLAVVAAAVAAAMTCASVFVLFLAALFDRGAATLLFALFGGAVLLTMLAIIFFVIEMLAAARGVRRAVDQTILATAADRPTLAEPGLSAPAAADPVRRPDDRDDRCPGLPADPGP